MRGRKARDYTFKWCCSSQLRTTPVLKKASACANMHQGFRLSCE
jgi:hypothetical protein